MSYWWTEDISKLLKSARHKRRLYQRARKHDEVASKLYEEYMSARKELRKAINKSKKQHWE